MKVYYTSALLSPNKNKDKTRGRKALRTWEESNLHTHVLQAKRLERQRPIQVATGPVEGKRLNPPTASSFRALEGKSENLDPGELE